MSANACQYLSLLLIIEVRMKKIFLYVVVGLLLIAIPATIFILGRQRDTRARAAPATTLSLLPATQTVKVGDDKVKVTVQMDPGANQVVTATIYLVYDTTKLTATGATNGANAPRILNSGKFENGTASISVGAASNAQPIASPGPVAVFTFTAKAGTTAISPATIQFASNTFVGGLNEPTANVLVGTTGAKITINDTNAAAASLDVGPTATPTATPIATPTATPPPAATQSAILITSPTENTSSSPQPTITGKAPPGATVTLVIRSNAITVTVTADANGNWTYTPATPLESGPHNVLASVLTAAGTTQTANTSFVVVGAGLGGGSASDAAVPVSGNVETTILLLVIGVLLIGSGSFVWLF